MSESELATCKYRITSKRTNHHLTTSDEVEGHIVVTSNVGQVSLSITPCVTGSVTDHAIITGPKGLYVALAKNAGDGARLIWSKTKYEWVIRSTGGSPPNYIITPRTGEDLYWIDKFGIGNVVIVKAGANVETPEQFWFLTKV